ncbi:MAG: glycosyltransferase family 39 protein [Anaerolineales bacterium]|nr:glycosyltransferase family 39 protein [Anaerolineales bacterium]
MDTVTFPTQPSQSGSWLDRPLLRRLTPAVLFLAAIFLLSVGLHFVNLEAIGDSNAYYTAAVESMLQSWHNFFFVAAEPGGAVTVDKPPLGLWIEAAFAAVLGVSGFSVSLPNILAGIFSVPLLYHLVKKHLGSLAGLVAALVLTITPTVLGTDRNNTMDGMLVLFLLLAAWAFSAAAETGRLRWLLLGAALVGLGFNIKMLQAFLPLPAFYALYFFGARTKWWRKLLSLALASVILLAVSLSWAVVVDLTPADQRPYVGSSTDNTVMELIVGHNGLNRLFGGHRAASAPQPGSDGPDGFAQNQSPDNPDQGSLPAQQQPQPGTDRGQLPNPPQEAVAACAGLTAGEACTVQLPRGGTVDGTCGQVQLLLICEPRDRAGQLPAQGAVPGQQQPPAGQQGGGGAGSAFSGEVGTPSVVRLFIPPLGKEMSWLLPLALVALFVLLFAARLRWPLESAHKALVLWGGWLVTCLVFFSLAEFFHAYYMIMLAPALGGVVGGGVELLWQCRARSRTAWILALAAVATLAFQWWLAVQFGENAWWLRLAAFLVAAGAAGLLLARFLAGKAALPLAFGLLVSGMLVTPLAWTVLTVTSQSPDVNLPGAYRGATQGVPGQMPGRQMSLADDLLTYLDANTGDVEYLVAVANANLGAPFILATGRPVLYMGGFSGGDPVVDAADLADMVANGELRFVLFTGDRSPNREISSWLQASCRVVPGFAGQGGGITLYQCSGELAPTSGSWREAQVEAVPLAPPGDASWLPPEALAACTGLNRQDACRVELRNGATANGLCRILQDQLVCVPEGQPQAAP